MWAAKLAGRVREGVFSSTCCRCSAIAPCWTFVCQCTSPLRYSGPLRVRCHECCRSFPIGMFPVATEPGMQNRTRLRFHRLHRQTGLYHQQCSPHSKGNSQHMPQHLSPCHSELLSCFAHHRTRTRHDGTTHRRRCVIESPHSRHRVGLRTLNACTSRRARGEGRPRGRIPPKASLFSLVGCDASGWDALPSSPLFAPPTHAGGRRSACVDALAVRVWAPQVGLRSLVCIYSRTDFDQGARGA